MDGQRVGHLEHEHDVGLRAIARRGQRDAGAILRGVALLGERDARAGARERRVRRVVVGGLDAESEPVAVERERGLDVRNGENRARTGDGEGRHQLWVCPPSATII